MWPIKNNLILSFLVGAICVFGFAPFGFFPVPIVALAVIFILFQQVHKPLIAAWIGFAFGLGLFSAGISWVYVALHDYGEMQMFLALSATLLFCAFLALFTALVGYVQAIFPVSVRLRALLVMPAIWVLVEWVRGTIFTGFPWLTLGYAQSDSPLAGYAPLLGVYGVSLLVAVSAGLMAYSYNFRSFRISMLMLVALWGTGMAFRAVNWTHPIGEPFSVALLQGNIPQRIKFDENALVGTLESYRRLVLESEARLIVLPETAFPLLRREVPQHLVEQLRDHAKRNGGDVLIGSFDHDKDGYYNSVFTLGSADEQQYRKHHLVPFGEFIPFRPLLGWFVNGVLNIPMGDLARGGQMQPPLQVAGQQVAPDICYEDVFGEEVIRHLPKASVLLNMTNDAWYGESHAAEQHNQISQMRALETGRMMLRATNTGVTSIIGSDGAVMQKLPQHQQSILLGMAQGYSGSTPYVRWGNSGVMVLIVFMLAYAWTRRTSVRQHK